VYRNASWRIEKLAKIICLLLVCSFLPGVSYGSAVSRLDQTAFSGPSGSGASDHTFTVNSFYSWLLTTFDEVCVPLIIVSNYSLETLLLLLSSID